VGKGKMQKRQKGANPQKKKNRTKITKRRAGKGGAVLWESRGGESKNERTSGPGRGGTVEKRPNGLDTGNRLSVQAERKKKKKWGLRKR